MSRQGICGLAFRKAAGKPLGRLADDFDAADDRIQVLLIGAKFIPRLFPEISDRQLEGIDHVTKMSLVTRHK
jgi:hypothetical protein